METTCGGHMGEIQDASEFWEVTGVLVGLVKAEYWRAACKSP